MQPGTSASQHTKPLPTGFHSIRTSLILAFVLSVLLPALVINLLVRERGVREETQQVTRQLEAAAVLKSDQITIWIEDMQRELGSVFIDTNAVDLIQWVLPDSEFPTLRDDSVLRLSAMFTDALQRTGRFEEIFLMDLSGTTLVSTMPDRVGSDWSHLSYFQLLRHRPYVEPPGFLPGDPETLVTFLLPVQDESQDIAVLGGRATLARLNRIMTERTGLGETGETYLVDANGNLLTDSRFPGYQPGQPVIQAQEIETTLANQQIGQGGYRNYRGKAVIGVYHWLSDLGAGLVAEQTRSEALQSTYETVNINVLVTLAAVVVVVLAGLSFVDGRMTRPLAKLSHISQQIAAGNLDVRSGIMTRNEIGMLAESLDTMTERLDTTIRDLQHHIEQLKQAEQEKAAAEEERVRLQQQIIDTQREAIRELSTPIIPIMDHVIIMPVIGTVDTTRARDIMRALLAGITQHQAQVVILDITGVSMIDTGVAAHLNQSIQAARLKGAHTIITGISDAIAETIVDLGIDWSDIETLGDLKTGLTAAVQKIDTRIDTRMKNLPQTSLLNGRHL